MFVSIETNGFASSYASCFIGEGKGKRERREKNEGRLVPIIMLTIVERLVRKLVSGLHDNFAFREVVKISHEE